MAWANAFKAIVSIDIDSVRKSIVSCIIFGSIRSGSSEYISIGSATDYSYIFTISVNEKLLIIVKFQGRLLIFVHFLQI